MDASRVFRSGLPSTLFTMYSGRQGVALGVGIVGIDEKPVVRRKIGHSIKYLPQGRLIPVGMKLHRAFDLYGVNYWTFVNRFPKFSRHHDAPSTSSPAAKPAWPSCILSCTATRPSTSLMNLSPKLTR